MATHNYLITADPEAGYYEYLHYDDATDESRLVREQDVSPILEDARDLRKGFDEKSNWKGDWHRVASIPLSVYYDLPDEIRLNPKALLKWLEQSDNSIFKTRTGTLYRNPKIK